jgi:folate-binding protein YgfZ
MATLLEQTDAIRRSAAIVARPEVRTLLLDGPDAERFLNGMVSNDVARLAPGSGMAAVKTTNKGRIEGLLRVRRIESGFLLDLREASAGKVLDSLARFIIMDDCAIRDASEERSVVSLLGPRAKALLDAPDLDPHGFVVRGDRTIVRDAMLGLEGYEVHVRGSADAAISELVAKGALAISLEALEIARVEAGIPLDGKDLDDDTIPLEARLEWAIDFHKGCYIGQEVIARATNLGGVKHILVGLLVDAPDPNVAGASLLVPETRDRTGEITSAVWSPSLGRAIALGYVRRAHEAPGTRLLVERPAASEASALVSPLPFVRSSSSPGTPDSPSSGGASRA